MMFVIEVLLPWVALGPWLIFSFDDIAVTGRRKGMPKYQVHHNSWVALVIPIDNHTSFYNRLACVFELLLCRLMSCLLV